MSSNKTKTMFGEPFDIPAANKAGCPGTDVEADRKTHPKVARIKREKPCERPIISLPRSDQWTTSACCILNRSNRTATDCQAAVADSHTIDAKWLLLFSAVTAIFNLRQMPHGFSPGR